MKRKRVQVSLGASGLALLVAVGAGLTVSQQRTVAQTATAPAYRVDPWFPRPFPEDYWVIGSVTGVAVDGQNHVWVLHRGNASLEGNERGMYPNPGAAPSSSVCCLAAPFVVQYDSAGNLINAWGGQAGAASPYKWPEVPGGIAVDQAGNVWITAGGQETPPPAPGRGGAAPAAGRGAAPAGRGGAPAAAPSPPPADAHVLKFTRDGQYLMTIGTPGKTELSNTTLNRPSAVAVDSAANEVFVADRGNRRIVVFDATSGAFKRQWFAYGAQSAGADPGPYSPGGAPAKSFRELSCIELARDGMVYVCDQTSNRIQVFDRSGKYIREAIIAPNTGGGILAGSFGVINAAGSVWDVAVSPDQQWLFVADGMNKKIRVLRRSDLTEVAAFGSGGRYPGQFLVVNSVATDSAGNVYTGETHHGKRVQKFVR